MAEYRDTRKGKNNPKLLLNKPINFQTSHLSKQVKSMRFCTDEEGNVWAMPMIPYHYDSATDMVTEGFSPYLFNDAHIEPTAVQNTWYTVADLTGDLLVNGIDVYLNAGSNENLEIELTVDAALTAVVGAISPATKTTLYTIYFNYAKQVSWYAGQMSICMGNRINCHHILVRIRKTSNNDAAAIIDVDLYYSGR